MWDLIDAVIEMVTDGRLALEAGQAQVTALMDIYLPLPEGDTRSFVVGRRRNVADYFAASVGE